MKKILGWSILGLFYLGVFTICVCAGGWLVPLIVFVVAPLIVAILIFAVKLIRGDAH